MDFQHVNPTLLSEGMELAMQAHASEHDAYIEARDRKALQPYAPQPPDIPQRDATMVILSAARPVAALTAVAGSVGLIVVAFASVGAAIAAFVTTHIVVVGSVGLGLVSLLLVFAGRGESGQVSSAPAGAAPQNITVTVNVAGQNLNTK
jgi:hypothetical protein